MRNPILAIAIVFVLAAPFTALAGDKKEKSIEINSYSWGVSNAGSMSSGTSGGASGRIGSPTMQKKHIGQPKYEDVSQSKGPLNTTANPALQGNVLQKDTVSGSTGPTKPTLPTTSRQR
jgi:hypothetical protein